jgi:hypothetical protein
MTKRREASNWVDRDEPVEGKLARVLSFLFDRDPAAPEVLEWASTIRSMVEADASEVQLAAYLGSLPGAASLTESPRLLAIAFWHIAKSGLVRDAAARRAEELGGAQLPAEPLSEFLERTILAAPEREQYRPPADTPKRKER